MTVGRDRPPRQWCGTHGKWCPRFDSGRGAMIDTDPVMPWVPMPWVSRAACRGMDTALFFPAQGGEVAGVVAVCEGCPVRSECLEHAMEHEHFGVWGGMSGKQRLRLRRQRGGERRRTNSLAQARYARVAKIARAAIAVGQSAEAAVLAADLGHATPAAARRAISHARKQGHDIPYVVDGGRPAHKDAP